MTLAELYTLLKTTGLPVTYREWPEQAAPPLPWIAYLAAYTNNFAADGGVYAVITHLQIELYTKDKDPAQEAKVEAALATVPGIFWEKTEESLDDEQCLEVLYEIEV